MNWHPQVSGRQDVMHVEYIFLIYVHFCICIILDWNAVDLFVGGAVFEFWLGPILTGFS